MPNPLMGAEAYMIAKEQEKKEKAEKERQKEIDLEQAKIVAGSHTNLQDACAKSADLERSRHK